MRAIFTIPVAPVTKKNHSQIIKVKTASGSVIPKIVPSEAYRKFEKDVEEYIPKLGVDYKINLKAIYFMPTRRKVDLCNLHEALCDVLVKHGCIVDDNSEIVATMDGSYVDYDKQNPRIYVELEKKE